MDTTFVGLAAILTKAASDMERARGEGLERAARLVEAEAKAEIGHYQDAAPPFAPWAPLADSTKDERVRLGYPEDEPGLREGDMRASYEHTVAGDTAYVGTNDDKAVWFELGTGRQPPRSVLGTAAVHKGQEVAEILGGGVVKALVGKDVVAGRMEIP